MTVAAEPRIAYHARRPHEICGFEILLTVRGSEFLALHGGIRRIAAGRPRMLRRSKSVEGSAITTLWRLLRYPQILALRYLIASASVYPLPKCSSWSWRLICGGPVDLLNPATRGSRHDRRVSYTPFWTQR